MFLRYVPLFFLMNFIYEENMIFFFNSHHIDPGIHFRVIKKIESVNVDTHIFYVEKPVENNATPRKIYQGTLKELKRKIYVIRRAHKFV